MNGSIAFAERMDEMCAKAVGERLIKIRMALGLGTQADAASRLGVQVSRYANWERGVVRIPVPYAAKLSDLTGVTLDYLFLGKLSSLPMRLVALLELPAGTTVPSKARRSTSRSA